MPNCALPIWVPRIVFDEFAARALPEVPTVVPPTNTPAKVVVVALPDRTRFLIVFDVAPSDAVGLCSPITAEAVPVFVFVIVRLLSVPDPPSDPSIVTRSAPFSLISAPVAEPVIARGAPVG